MSEIKLEFPKMDGKQVYLAKFPDSMRSQEALKMLNASELQIQKECKTVQVYDNITQSKKCTHLTKYAVVDTKTSKTFETEIIEGETNVDGKYVMFLKEKNIIRVLPVDDWITFNLNTSQNKQATQAQNQALQKSPEDAQYQQISEFIKGNVGITQVGKGVAKNQKGGQGNKSKSKDKKLQAKKKKVKTETNDDNDVDAYIDNDPTPIDDEMEKNFMKNDLGDELVEDKNKKSKKAKKEEEQYSILKEDIKQSDNIQESGDDSDNQSDATIEKDSVKDTQDIEEDY